MKCDILVLSPEFGYGGIGNHTFKIANFLLDDGFRVRVYTIKNKKVRSLFHSNSEVEEITRPILGFDLFNPFFDVVSHLRLMGKKKPSLIIRPIPPFYLHIPWISNTVIPELVISHGVHRTLIETLKAVGKTDVKDKYLLSALSKMLIESSEKIMLDKAKRIVAVSEYTKMQLVKQYNIDEQKIDVIHNFVDNNVFRRKKNNEITSEIGNKVKNFKDSSFLAVFVGRPTPGKNLSLIYNIIRNFYDEPHLKFVIVGMNRNDKYVREYAKRLKRSNVLFLGNVDNNLLPDLYSLSDFLLVTSFDENLPTVLLEAMACGAIPISTEVGGIPEVIEDHKNGFLLRPNKEDFCNIIHDLVNCDQRTLGTISKKAEKTIDEKFNIDIIKNRYVRVVNEILSN